MNLTSVTIQIEFSISSIVRNISISVTISLVLMMKKGTLEGEVKELSQRSPRVFLSSIVCWKLSSITKLIAA